jgi:Family of unknown function (DUF6223)
MKNHRRASLLNAILILLVTIPTYTLICPIGISGQTIQQKYPENALATHVSLQQADRVYGMTSRRFVASMAAAIGLIGGVIGGLALARPAGRFGTASGRLGAIVALAAGLIGFALGGVVVLTATGGFGTGGGLAGAIVALVLGLIAMALGGLALARSRRSG